MATATAKLIVNPYPKGVDYTQRCQYVAGLVTLLAASTYINNGIPLVWFPMVDGSNGGTFIPESSTPPFVVYIESISGGTYTYLWDSVHQTIRIFLAATEVLTGAAIPPLVYSDLIQFVAQFVKDV